MPNYFTGSKYEAMPTSYTATATTEVKADTSKNKPERNHQELLAEYERAMGRTYTPKPAYTAAQAQQTIKKIEATLVKVNGKRRDMNGDGEWNCQDAVRQFRELWPESVTVLNEHIGPTGHLFIQVPLGDDVIYVEPQRVYKWRMREAWTEWESVKQYNKVIDWI
jgi:hypothetical protein